MNAQKQKLIEKKRQQITSLMREVADLACPFKVGDIIEKTEGYQRGKYRIEEVNPCMNKEGYRMIGRRYSDTYDYLTLQYKDLATNLKGFHLIKEEQHERSTPTQA